MQISCSMAGHWMCEWKQYWGSRWDSRAHWAWHGQPPSLHHLPGASFSQLKVQPNFLYQLCPCCQQPWVYFVILRRSDIVIIVLHDTSVNMQGNTNSSYSYAISHTKDWHWVIILCLLHTLGGFFLCLFFWFWFWVFFFKNNGFGVITARKLINLLKWVEEAQAESERVPYPVWGFIGKCIIIRTGLGNWTCNAQQPDPQRHFPYAVYLNDVLCGFKFPLACFAKLPYCESIPALA